jgi:hypothetical protein
MSTTTPEKLDIVANINQNGVFYPILLILLCLITFILLFVHKKELLITLFSVSTINGQQSVEASVNDTILLLFSVFFIVVFLFMLVPNFGVIKNLLLEMKTMTFVMIYTTVLVLLLTRLPSSYFDQYSYIFTPVSALIGAFLVVNSYADGFSKSGFKEDIRSIVLFTSLIAMTGTFYAVNPGGIVETVSKNIWYKLVAGLIAFVGLLYTIIDLSVFTSAIKTTKTNTNYFVKPGIVLLLGFIASLAYGIKHNRSAFNDGVSSSGIGLLTLLTVFIWSILFSTGISERLPNFGEIKEYRKSLLILFGSALTLLFVTWLIKNINNAPLISSMLQWSFMIVLGLAILGFLYKVFAKTIGQTPELKDGATSFFRFFNSELSGTDPSSLVALILVLMAFGVYFISPFIYNKVSLRGGETFVKNPINLNEEHTLATYEQLNGPIDIGNDAAKELQMYNYYKTKQKSVFNYSYGLSFWVYIDSAAPNTNASYSKYTSILNYGQKPNILYKASTNTLLVTFNAKPDLDFDSLNESNDLEGVIVYKNDKFLLQRWNHFVINYNGTNLDIFLNGELVKANIKATPSMKLDSLVTGTNSGIYGGLCNLVYYRKPLTITQIYYIYNMLKDKKPPVL